MQVIQTFVCSSAAFMDFSHRVFNVRRLVEPNDLLLSLFFFFGGGEQGGHEIDR